MYVTVFFKESCSGTHSFRKGIATFLSACPGGANVLSIFKRLGWSIGEVPDRYIAYDAGQDQIVGRCAAGHDVADSNFSILPPHFTPDFEIGFDWEEIIPGFFHFPSSFKSTLPFLLASVCYHHDFLLQMLDGRHPFFQSALWRSGHISRLASEVINGIGSHVTSGLRATGVPPNVILAQEIHAIGEKLVCLQGAFGDFRKQVSADINSLNSSIPKGVSDRILDEIQIQGLQPLTKDSVLELVRDASRQQTEVFIATLNCHQATILDALGSRGQPLQETAHTLASAPLPIVTDARLFMWGNSLCHRVPKGYHFPMFVAIYPSQSSLTT
jgi:hypothetical protein